MTATIVETPRWSPQQDRALMEVSEWLRDESGPQVYKLFGYAGTGKTTLAQHLAKDIPNGALFAAYTGKAASVLRAKGCPSASTIHGLIYIPQGVDHELMAYLKTRIKELSALLNVHDGTPNVTPESREKIAAELDMVREQYAEMRELAKKGPAFTINEESPIRSAGAVFIDECSMVNEDMGEDLLSFGKKVLVLGDPAQLPPVKGGGFFTAGAPNLLLTEIHRQALDNPIIRYATDVREGRPLMFGDHGAAKKIRKTSLGPQDMYELGGQILTGQNKTRRKINAGFRRYCGHSDPYPVAGDKLVCLRNDKTHAVLNGVLCDAAEDAREVEGETDTIDITIKYEGRDITAPADTAAFDAYADPSREDDITMFRPGILSLDYGYALTVHKSQGSQWDKVVIADDGFGHWDRTMRARWLYTAITRAAKELVIIA